MPTQTPSEIRLAGRIKNLTGSVARDILSRTQNKDIISFAGGLPDASLWQNLQLPATPPAAYQYGPSEGELPLRQILASRAATLGLPANAQTTLITSGSQQGLDLAAKLFLEAGTPLILEAPTYLAALQVFQLFEANIHALPLNAEGLEPDALDALLTRTQAPLVYLNPTFQNPSGACYSLKRRKQIAAVLDAHNTVLLEDDPYRDISYEDDAPPPIARFLQKTPWIYLSSVSKTLIPGLRLGSLCCSPQLFEPLLKLKQAADLHSNRPAQFVAAQMLDNPAENQKRILALRHHYRQKRDHMQSALQQHFGDIAQWTLPRGGMFFWLTLPQSRDLAAALESTLQQGVAFMPGSPFFLPKQNNPCCLRLNFSLVPLEKMQQGLRILSSVLKRQQSN
ncbi:aminotransferase, classes I and II superfamily [Verrucomicrobiia bacterium DG1235]|nr:aminotransferase, classes I and II superfamily [Verrucomicrobiae bacterium DG1235]